MFTSNKNSGQCLHICKFYRIESSMMRCFVVVAIGEKAITFDETAKGLLSMDNS